MIKAKGPEGAPCMKKAAAQRPHLGHFFTRVSLGTGLKNKNVRKRSFIIELYIIIASMPLGCLHKCSGARAA